MCRKVEVGNRTFVIRGEVASGGGNYSPAAIELVFHLIGLSTVILGMIAQKGLRWDSRNGWLSSLWHSSRVRIEGHAVWLDSGVKSQFALDKGRKSCFLLDKRASTALAS